MSRVKGKVAIVTGGASGIGRGCAVRLAEEGAAVIVTDIDLAMGKETVALLDGPGTFLEHDVTDELQWQGVVEQVVSEYRDLHILVNNAGIAGPTEPSWEYALEDWRRVIDVDLNALYYCCRAVIPRMREQNYGRVVNVASIAGKEGNPNASAYSSSKAGVIGLTKSLGKELAQKNIAVNCVTPAAAKTRIFDQMTQEHICLLYTSPSPRDLSTSRMPSSA